MSKIRKKIMTTEKKSKLILLEVKGRMKTTEDSLKGKTGQDRLLN